jgi:DNA-binding transcriptional LysR family regulator
MPLSDRAERRMKLRDLRVLMAVIAAGSMRKAAARLNTTQPSVSRAIADLEAALGVSLVDRTPVGVEPTEYGRALFDGGVAMFDDLRQAVNKIEFLADPTRGEVHLGTVPAFAASFVAAVIDRLSRRHPGIRFHLVTGLVESLEPMLLDRSIDLAIAARIGPLAGETIGFEFLFHGSFVVAAGAGHPLARRHRKIVLAELVNEKWTLPSPTSAIGSLFRNVFRDSGLEYPVPAIVADPIDVRMSLLSTGRFLTMFDPCAMRFPRRQRDIVPLRVELPIAAAQIGVLTLQNRTLNPAARLFISCAHEVATRWRGLGRGGGHSSPAG